MANKQHKISADTDLSKLCNPGDRVRLWLLPIDKYKLNTAGDDSDPSLAGRELLAIRAGVIDATICENVCRFFDHDAIDADSVPGVELREISLPEYAPVDAAGADSLGFLAGQITHLQVIRAAARPEKAQFGDRLRLEFKSGALSVNGVTIDPAFVAGLWIVRGYALPDGAPSFTPEQLRKAWHADTYVTPDGLRSGCARATLEQLDQALDWAAEKLGWL